MASVAHSSRNWTPLSAEERARLDALLKIAAESPYPGERGNALDAARRLADRHGMSLQEAASEPRTATRTMRMPRSAGTREVADFIVFSETRLRAEKERYERALSKAVERGLDNGVRVRSGDPGRTAPTKPNGRCRSPYSFAKVLLSETSLPLREIVSLTGLDIYRVVGLKLKMRSPA